jgi:hypothetical protein
MEKLGDWEGEGRRREGGEKRGDIGLGEGRRHEGEGRRRWARRSERT